MAATTRLPRLALALLVATTLAAPLGPPSSAHATTRVDDELAADMAATRRREPCETMRFRFWIGPFEFSLTIGDGTPLALAFEGLR